ncbi:hypothetical protein EDC04DRAFT_1596886 [Pisolithus marmoratus]|nr:hypothetical protein EDC04DRAFT_1596886 [Pisolithus marmoratus]
MCAQPGMKSTFSKTTIIGHAPNALAILCILVCQRSTGSRAHHCKGASHWKSSVRSGMRKQQHHSSILPRYRARVESEFGKSTWPSHAAAQDTSKRLKRPGLQAWSALQTFFPRGVSAKETPVHPSYHPWKRLLEVAIKLSYRDRARHTADKPGPFP